MHKIAPKRLRLAEEPEPDTFFWEGDKSIRVA